MKSRLVMFLTLILSTASLVLLGGTSAQAATYSATLSQLHPVSGEVVRISGALNPPGRTLTLQRYVHGRWLRVTSRRTVSYGRYAFNVRALSTSYAYRSYAPKVKIKHRTYAAAYSRLVRVTSVKASLSLSVGSAPVAQTQTGTRDLTPAIAAFRPARPGAAVAVEKLVSGRWISVATARQNTSGVAYLQVPAGSGTAGTFRANSRPGTGASYTYSPWATSSPRSLQWNDEFHGTTLDATKWKFRPQPRVKGTLRSCAQPSADRISVSSDVAVLSIRKSATVDSSCPSGVWDNAMIEALPGNAFNSSHGTYAARVKFNSSQGMHGSFWLQGNHAQGGAEIDVAEYFGDGRADGGLTSFVHYAPTGGTGVKSGGARAYGSILGAGRPSSGWHVYSVDWSPSGYVFRLDGTPIFSTSTPRVASTPEAMILSLLSSDYEIPRIKSASSTMSVDWVRVWQ